MEILCQMAEMIYPQTILILITNSTNGPPGLPNGTIPSNARNQILFNNDNAVGLNGDRGSFKELNIYANGTMIFSGGQIKIYELS